ncbi:DUF4249 family protein [Winogradskyella sp. A2]|uniref:DUF4249 family protein n=1 Tax=Winogradskyella sp. A2 TaxID=3366944 RepID=UPI00398C2AA1
MKKILLLLIIVSSLYRCEDVIDVELNESDPRLVIEASINWFKGTQGNEQSIKLSLSAPFFEENVPPASGAIVQVFDSNNNTFNFVEDSNTGIYSNNTFIPVIDDIYTLSIFYDNELYTSTETFKSVVPIEFVEQIDDGGFSGEDIELKAFYTDPANIENYYFFEFISDISVVPNLEVYEDRFTDGNQIFGFYTEEDLESGDVVTIRNYGVSERFYEYMFILLQQGSEENGGPFETQPATVRGNCINQTNPDNFPFGYFRLSEVDELIYTVQ